MAFFMRSSAANIPVNMRLCEKLGLNPDIYLAFMAGTKLRDLQNIMQNYEPFGYKSVIVTNWKDTIGTGIIPDLTVLHLIMRLLPATIPLLLRPLTMQILPFSHRRVSQ